jgi:hypothetical protein
MKWMRGNIVLIDTSTHMVMLRDPVDKKGFLVHLPRDIAIHNAANTTLAKPLRIYQLYVSFQMYSLMTCLDYLRTMRWNSR